MRAQPTIGEMALRLAQDLANIAVARATQSREWTEHPMFGIAVDKDQWALAYQAKTQELQNLLTPNNEVSEGENGK